MEEDRGRHAKQLRIAGQEIDHDLARIGREGVAQNANTDAKEDTDDPENKIETVFIGKQGHEAHDQHRDDAHHEQRRQDVQEQLHDEKNDSRDIARMRLRKSDQDRQQSDQAQG